MWPFFVFTYYRACSFASSIIQQAIGIEVDDAALAYEQCQSHSGRGGGGSGGVSVSVQPPARVTDRDGRGSATIAEVKAYGDVVLRFISFDGHRAGGRGNTGAGGETAAAAKLKSETEAGTETNTASNTEFGNTEPGTDSEMEADTDGAFSGAFLPNFVDVGGGEPGAGPPQGYGLERADHIVGNVWDMLEHVRGIGPSRARCILFSDSAWGFFFSSPNDKLFYETRKR